MTRRKISDVILVVADEVCKFEDELRRAIVQGYQPYGEFTMLPGLTTAKAA
jgi:hypothetical protein